MTYLRLQTYQIVEIMKEAENLNNAQTQALNIPVVSDSTVIESISCELSESTKAHMEILEWTKNAFNKYAAKVLMMPKEMFGS